MMETKQETIAHKVIVGGLVHLEDIIPTLSQLSKEFGGYGTYMFESMNTLNVVTTYYRFLFTDRSAIVWTKGRNPRVGVHESRLEKLQTELNDIYVKYLDKMPHAIQGRSHPNARLCVADGQHEYLSYPEARA